MTQLTESQRAAVEHRQGPLLVLAGAGSGKTRVITHRIAKLVEHGVRPESILAVSFTNKSAAEMSERIEPLIGRERSQRLWLSTFHSFGVRFLSEEIDALGYGERFVIFDQGDSLGLIRDMLRRTRGSAGEKKLDAAAILARISRWKNLFLDPETVSESDVEYDAVAKDLYPRYESALKSMHAVDFDDLVVVPAKLLKTRDDLRGKWRSRLRHLLIDEFQDTNHVQLELVRLLTNELGNVCVVGDDDQSIYSWRGADVSNILEFEKHFPGTTIVKLEENYRSRKAILNVANTAMERGGARRHKKTLRSVRGAGDKVRMCVLDTQEQEGKFVAAEIRDLCKEGLAPKDIAVLYRSNLQARLLEQELREQRVPYRLFGGTQFFDRKEIKDAAAYLRLVVNPRDELSLRRVINHPPRGIGDTTVAKIAEHAKARNTSFGEALSKIDVIDGIPEAAKRGAHSFLDALAHARQAFRGGTGLSSAARSLFDASGVTRDLAESSEGPSATRRKENIDFLLRSLDRYEHSSSDTKPSLATFLARITLRFDEEAEDPGNRVTLSTLHAAKGLEFHTVFLIGCVEGQLPHSRTTDPKVTEIAPADVDEERRLFYVGVTRAKERLYLSRFGRRMLRGRITPVAPSRFLEGLSEDDLELYERNDAGPMGVDEIAEMTRSLLARLGGAQSPS